MKKRVNGWIAFWILVVIFLAVVFYNSGRNILFSPFCVDTDSNATYPDGKNIYKLGNIYNGTSWGTDSCTNIYRISDAVKEYYCRSDGGIANAVYLCPNGCVDGVCRPNDCTDSDGGINYYEKGVVKYNGINYSDYCFNSSRIIEYYCDVNSGNRLRVNYSNCAGGCSNGNNGACVVPIPIVYGTYFNLFASDYDDKGRPRGNATLSLYGENLSEEIDISIDGIKNPFYIIDINTADDFQLDIVFNVSDPLFRRSFPEFFYTPRFEVLADGTAGKVFIADENGRFVSSIEAHTSKDHSLEIAPKFSAGTGKVMLSPISLILNTDKFFREIFCLTNTNLGGTISKGDYTIYNSKFMGCGDELYILSQKTTAYQWLYDPAFGKIGLCYLTDEEIVREKRDCRKINGVEFNDINYVKSTKRFDVRRSSVEKIIDIAIRYYIGIYISPPYVSVNEKKTKWGDCSTNCVVYLTDWSRNPPYDWVACSSPQQDPVTPASSLLRTQKISDVKYMYIKESKDMTTQFRPVFRGLEVIPGWWIDKLLSIENSVYGAVDEITYGNNCGLEKHNIKSFYLDGGWMKVSSKGSYDSCVGNIDTTSGAYSYPTLKSFQSAKELCGLSDEGYILEKTSTSISGKLMDRNNKACSYIYDSSSNTEFTGKCSPA